MYEYNKVYCVYCSVEKVKKKIKKEEKHEKPAKKRKQEDSDDEKPVVNIPVKLQIVWILINIKKFSTSGLNFQNLIKLINY